MIIANSASSHQVQISGERLYSGDAASRSYMSRSWSPSGFGSVLRGTSFPTANTQHFDAVIVPNWSSLGDLYIAFHGNAFTPRYFHITSSGDGTQTEATGVIGGRAGDMHPARGAVAVGKNSSPFVAIYQFTRDGYFGTKYTDPSSVVTLSSVRRVRFSPSGNSIAIAGDSTTSSINAYSFSLTTGWGTKRQGLTSNILSQGVNFDPSGSAILYVLDGGVWYYARTYTDNGGLGTLYTAGSAISNTSFTSDIVISDKRSVSGSNLVVAVAANDSPYIHAWPWNAAGTGFGTKFANPSSLLTQSAENAAFNASTSSDLNVLFAHGFNAWTLSATGFGVRYTQTDGVPSGASSTAYAYKPATKI